MSYRETLYPLITVSAIGDTPMVDYAYPSAEALTIQLKEKNAPETDIKKLNDNYTAMLEIFGSNQKPKDILNQQQSDNIRNLNYQTSDLLLKHDIDVKGVGSNSGNALYYMAVDSGSTMRLKYVGAVGKDPTGDYIKDSFNKNGIELVDFGISMSATREGIALLSPGAHDRRARSLSYEVPKDFNQENLLAACKTSSMVMIEAPIIKITGRQGMLDLAQTLVNNGKKLITSPPTKDDYFKDEMGHMRHKYFKAHKQLSQAATLRFMNEKEAVTLVLGRRHAEKLQTVNDPDFIKTLEVIQRFMADDKSTNSNRKLTFITFGEQGSIGITNKFHTHADANVVNVVNPIGAGDGFKAGVITKYLNSGDKALIENYVKKLLKRGNDLAAAVIGYPGAQIPQEIAKAALIASDKGNHWDNIGGNRSGRIQGAN